VKVQEATACLFIPICGDIKQIVDERGKGRYQWSAGPMPFQLPKRRNESIRALTSENTNFSTRAHYWNKRFSSSLYGDINSENSKSSPNPVRRWHLELPDDTVIGTSTFRCLEIQKYPYDSESAWLMLHLHLDPNECATSLSQAIHFFKPEDGGRWAKPSWWIDYFSEKVDLDLDGRVRAISHTYFSESLEKMHPWASDWDSAVATPFNSWAFTMATGIKSVPTIETLTSGTLTLSQDWSCMILRDGWAFVALRPSEFHSSGKTYVSSIYADAFVAGLIQLKQAISLSEEILSVNASPNSKLIIALQEKVLRTKAEFWMSNPANASTIAQRVIDEFRRQHSLDISMDEITSTVKNLADFQLATAGYWRDLQTHSFALIAALVLPMSLSLSLISAIPDHNAGHVYMAISAGLVCSAFFGFLFWWRRRKFGR
jgi:hypothetical protein